MSIKCANCVGKEYNDNNFKLHGIPSTLHIGKCYCEILQYSMKSVEEEIQKNKELLIKKELDEEKQKIKLHLKSCQNCKAIEELHKLCDKYKGVKRMQFIKDSILLHLDCKGLEIEICNTCEFKKYVDPIIDEFSRDSNDDESFGKLHHVFKDYFDCDRFSSCGNPVDLSQFSEY